VNLTPAQLSQIATLVSDIDASLTVSDYDGIGPIAIKLDDIEVKSLTGQVLGTIKQAVGGSGVVFQPFNGPTTLGIKIDLNPNKKIQNIKGVRSITNEGLKESKERVDAGGVIFIPIAALAVPVDRAISIMMENSAYGAWEYTDF
jgi:ribosomal protein L7/L12